VGKTAAAPPADDATGEEAAAVEKPVVEKPSAAKKPVEKKAAKGSLPTTTAEKIAWCRANDAGKG
jgi:hypothetical protein